MLWFVLGCACVYTHAHTHTHTQSPLSVGFLCASRVWPAPNLAHTEESQLVERETETESVFVVLSSKDKHAPPPSTHTLPSAL